MSDVAPAAEQPPKDMGEWARYWAEEFSSVKQAFERWHKYADEATRRFLDEREDAAMPPGMRRRLNLFWSNMTTLQGLLYGKTPKVDVSRRFEDSEDDDARVGAFVLSRLLNCDVERGHDGYSGAIRNALWDRLLAGLGTVKLRIDMDVAEKRVPEKRYRRKNGSELTAPGYNASEVTPGTEEVYSDHVNWRDQRWSAARTWAEVRWWAFRSYLAREEVEKRFPVHADKVPYASRRNAKDGTKVDWLQDDPRGRCEVWEIWDKDRRLVHWYVEGYDVLLDQKQDLYGLQEFWPAPPPMFANVTTQKLMPVPDHQLAKDLYDEVDTLTVRIGLLEEAIRVAGVYDSGSDALKDLLSTRAENKMIPVTNWGQFSERGKIEGAVDWFPLKAVVEALQMLRDLRQEAARNVAEVTGMSDIIRGQAASAASATEQAIKARFASVRVQSLQDEFARFASDVQRIKVELISKFYRPPTILARSNLSRTFDAGMAQRAVATIKDAAAVKYRIAVRPENVSLPDQAQIRQERTELITGVSAYLQAAFPMAQALPGSMPFLLQMLKWLVAGFRGADTVEGVIDQAVAASSQLLQQGQQQPGQQPPDPKLQAALMKAQADLQKVAAEAQADLQRIQAETQGEIVKQAAQAHFNVEEARATAAIKRATGGGVP